MESNRFDRLTRSWSSRAPRRAVVAALVGGAFGAAVLVDHDVSAKKKKKITMCLNGKTITVKKSKKAQLLGQGATTGACPAGPTCPSTQKLCNGRCIDKTSCCTSADCDPCKQQICQNETCTCKPGTIADTEGFCGVPPANGASCGTAGATVGSAGLCCSSTSVKPNPLVEAYLCLAGTTTCRTSIDCGGGACRGFMCPALYAATVGDACPSA